MTRRSRSQEELRNASDSLIYEYWMLKGTTHLLLHHDDITEIGLLRNALLESFLIHARALVDFFFVGKFNREDDAIAGDYFDEREKDSWETHHADPDWFKDARARINMGVAHISYERRKDVWDYMLIEREISNTLDEFVKRVSVDLLSARWETTKHNIRTGSESPIELPPFLMKGGILKTSFYPLPNPDWFPDKQGDD